MFGCSVDGVCLLFLPAAATEFGRYWSMDAASDTAEGILRAFGTHWQPNGYITLTVQHNRQSRYVVRLASRSGLSGCSVLVVASVPARWCLLVNCSVSP